MHFHAEHGLFFERRQPLRRAAAGLALTAVALVVNAAANNVQVSLAGMALAAVLFLIAHTRGQQRVEPALSWTLAIVVATVLAGLFVSRGATQAAQIGARVLCGVTWVLWLGTQVDWASLRQLLLHARVPEGVVASLDHGLMHGVLTQREWTRRRDAARLRLGTPRLPLAAWGPLLGEGALQAFIRLESVEENALLRSDAGSNAESNADKPDETHLRSVDVERGGSPVLQQVDLQFQASEWVAVCGPSGAGKSTLLRLIAGLDGPTEGTLSRLGTRITPTSPLGERIDGRIALLSQNPEHHFIASTVAEDISWGLLRRGAEPAEARNRCTEVARALRVDHLLERPCHELSFGEQRRVALAGLLVLEPAILLLDEPTAGLDPVTAHDLRALVQAFVRRSRATCIWATHDLDSLPPEAKRVILIRDRHILFDGPTDEGLARPMLVEAGLALPEAGDAPC